MDIVECLAGRERPITLRIVDIEAAVGRRPVRLDGAEIGADDIRLRVIFGHFQGPFAGAGADVKNAARVRVLYWCAVQIAAEEKFEDVVR